VKLVISTSHVIKTLASLEVSHLYDTTMTVMPRMRWMVWMVKSLTDVRFVLH